jgi:predicted dehydrogenase
MKYRMIQVGTGGWGKWWCEKFLPPNVQEGLIEVVAAVDIDPQAHENAQKFLGLPARRCYTDVRKALDENPADFCTIVTPPWVHEQVVDEALAHNLHILSEKPIADTLEASVRIAHQVRRAGRKMAVTMSHRFDQDKTTLRTELRSGRYGRLDYLMCRFTCDCRKFGSWGQFRHELKDALLIDGAVHHLDILADLAGARCDTLYTQAWNPPWGKFNGVSQALVLMQFPNATHAFYEAAKCNAVGLNGWGNEYIRAECEGATLMLSRRKLERFDYNPVGDWAGGLEGGGTPMPLLEQPKWANTWLVEQFVRWLDGGEPMATNVADNLQSMALVAAAIQSAHSGQPVKVQELLAQTERAVQ